VRSSETLPARRTITAMVWVLLLGYLGGWTLIPGAAVAARYSVQSVNIYKSRGFMHAEGWFEEAGPGTSRVSLWIESYQATTGAFLSSYGRRDGTSSCDRAGSKCYVLLKTSVQAQWAECYVARARSVRAGAGQVMASDPPGELFCP
jgi:hypothetical protein